MKPKFKQHPNGFYVPESDTECSAVAFDTADDLELALPLCTGKMIAVQAGGNFGWWAKRLSKHFGMVYTFEPDPMNFSCMCRNIGDVQNIVKIQAALGEEHNCIDLMRKDGNAGAHYVDGYGLIPTMLIDDLNLPACDLLVLDIEGMELPALKGAYRTIDSYQPVIQLELKGHGKRYGYEDATCIDWLKGFGYTVKHSVHRDIILSV